jgi:hypothetical protein
MNSKRQEPRKKLLKFTTVYELRHKTLLGYVGDLTLKGALVTGEKALEVDSHFILGIEFPEAPPTMTVTRIVLPARVAWCRRDDSPHGYNVGFEFTEMSAENSAIIEAILERYQFRNVMDASDLDL